MRATRSRPVDRAIARAHLRSARRHQKARKLTLRRGVRTLHAHRHGVSNMIQLACFVCVCTSVTQACSVNRLAWPPQYVIVFRRTFVERSEYRSVNRVRLRGPHANVDAHSVRLLLRPTATLVVISSSLILTLWARSPARLICRLAPPVDKLVDLRGLCARGPGARAASGLAKISNNKITVSTQDAFTVGSNV